MMTKASTHVAQFFDDDRVSVRRIADFLVDGARSGDAIVIVATTEHVRAIERRLASLGAHVEALAAEGRYHALDARTAMQRVCPSGSPNSVLFGEVIGGAVERAAAGGGRVRAYGELVSLLWNAGRRDDAIQIEHLWNELLNFHEVRLLCGYSFSGAIDAAGFGRIAATHLTLEPPPARLFGTRISAS